VHSDDNVKVKIQNTAFSIITYLNCAEMWHVLKLKSQIRVSFASLFGKQQLFAVLSLAVQ